MVYQAELKEKFKQFMLEKRLTEKRNILASNKEKIKEKKLVKLKNEAEDKLRLLEEFKKLLDEQDFKEKLIDE